MRLMIKHIDFMIVRFLEVALFLDRSIYSMPKPRIMFYENYKAIQIMYFENL
jgi:hypothetical protein